MTQMKPQRLPEYVVPKSEKDALQKIGQLAHTIHEHAYLKGSKAVSGSVLNTGL